MDLKFTKLRPNAVAPVKSGSSGACFKLMASTIDVLHQDSLPAVIVGTGVAFDVPAGHVLKLYSLPAHGVGFGVNLACGPHIVDSESTGELKIKLVSNTLNGAGFINNLKAGDPVALALLLAVSDVSLVEVKPGDDAPR